MNIGLYFGTFNPIHVGHLIIANHLAEYTDLDEVWIVVTPQNPLKQKKSLLADFHRLAMVKEAIDDNRKLKASDVEFKMPRPNYTIHTLTYLIEKYPSNNFALIMGEDNLRGLHRWFNYEQILEKHKIYVYPRVLTIQESEAENAMKEAPSFSKHPNVILCDSAPLMKVSSSFIRKAIKAKKDVRYLLSEPVFRYIDEMKFYQ